MLPCFDDITFPLECCDHFLRCCWKAFKNFSTQPVNRMDQCDIALPTENLSNVLSILSRKISVEEIEETMEIFQLDSGSSLSWNEFKEFASCLFTPIFQRLIKESGSSLRMNNVHKPTHVHQHRPIVDSSMSSSTLQSTLIPVMGRDYHEERGHPRDKPRSPHPFDIMLRKQRYNSCLDANSQVMPSLEIPLSSSNSTDVLVSDNSSILGLQNFQNSLSGFSASMMTPSVSSSSILPNTRVCKVPARMISDASVELFKREFREKRKKLRGFSCPDNKLV